MSGGGRLRGGPVPSLRARSAVRSTTRRALPADDDRRVPSRSWSSEVPNRRRRPGRRHDWREVRLAEWSGSGTERSAEGAGLGRPEGVWSAGGGSCQRISLGHKPHSGHRASRNGLDCINRHTGLDGPLGCSPTRSYAPGDVRELYG